MTALAAVAAALAGCSRPPPRPSPPPPPAESERAIQLRELERPNEPAREPYRAPLPNGGVLYLAPTFTPKRGGYDLLIHFHGEGRWQEANVARAGLDVAVVSVNLGVGTEPYSNAFRGADAFERLLSATHEAIVKAGRDEGAKVRRIAFSAWSAGFSSISRLMNDRVAERIDAVLLADGFFTNFTDPKRRTVNAQALAKFARFAEAAERGDKLFAITHTTIPTGPYPSVQECVVELLSMLDLEKVRADAVGPREMHQIYAVDRGNLHIRGFEGTRASDHVKQLQAMGETMYPWLKERWDRQDAGAGR